MYYAALIMKFFKELKIKHIAAVTIIVAILLLRILWKYITNESHPDVVCYEDFNDDYYGHVVCRPRCFKGHHSLPGMDTCEKNLGCREIHSSNFITDSHTGAGAVKSVRF